MIIKTGIDAKETIKSPTIDLVEYSLMFFLKRETKYKNSVNPKNGMNMIIPIMGKSTRLNNSNETIPINNHVIKIKNNLFSRFLNRNISLIAIHTYYLSHV